MLASGRGNDTLDGGNGIDTADYSRDRFFDAGSTAARVVVRLGIGNSRAEGTGVEFAKLVPDNAFVQISTDILIDIENVIGTEEGDDIVGNVGGNTLDGRGGNDVLDGHRGNDVLIGGAGTGDTASFASHDGILAFSRIIRLGLNGADGSASISTVVEPEQLDVLRGIENVTGTSGSDAIFGNEQDNVLRGRGGDDRVEGGQVGTPTILGMP